jgi:hypothetical protein
MRLLDNFLIYVQKPFESNNYTAYQTLQGASNSPFSFFWAVPKYGRGLGQGLEKEMEDDQIIKAHTKMHGELRNLGLIVERLPYHWLNRPKPIPWIWMVYFGMADDYARELANVINQLANDIEKLCAWKKVLPGYAEEERAYLVREFIEPLCTMCINVPYAIRSRIIFSVTHLSHQANMALLEKTWKDNLPKDDAINFKIMDKHAIHWSAYVNLKASMQN